MHLVNGPMVDKDLQRCSKTRYLNRYSVVWCQKRTNVLFWMDRNLAATMFARP